MRPHAFFQRPATNALEETHRRSEDRLAQTGRVVSASYLTRAKRWFNFWPWRKRNELEWRTPFDSNGSDSLWLMGDIRTAPRAEGVRIINGRVLSLDGSEQTVIQDLWVGDPCIWLLTEGYDFAVLPDNEPPIVVSFGLAPLVIAQPKDTDTEHELESFFSETRQLMPARIQHGYARMVCVHPGQRIEVAGLIKGLASSTRTYSLAGWQHAYRREPRPVQVLGDEDGTRLIIRVLS